MTKWMVTLEGIKAGQEDDIVLIFTDTQDIMKPPIIERYILQDVTKVVKKQDHYSKLPNVKKVECDKETIPRAKTALILLTLKKTKEKMGVLLSLTDAFNFEVRGLRPDDFVIKVSQNNEIVTEILTKLTKDPKAFEDVNLVLPEDRF
ncbi:MAG: hypothetical protein HWN66_00140 [Candidatus Helarchaeota archaeon]|nr:hypothetical protein [Candidatus Helarchaeota archaeon]